MLFVGRGSIGGSVSEQKGLKASLGQLKLLYDLTATAQSELSC